MNVTVLGLGLMGLAVATRLHQCGHQVIGWNRSSAGLEREADQGLKTVQEIDPAIAEAEVIILTLSDAAAINEVLKPAMTSGRLRDKAVLMMSTISPQESRALGDMIARHDGAYLETPVLGSIPEAQSGRLIIMAAGPESLYQRYLLMLRGLGHDVEHVGELGQAAAMKLAMNQLIATLTTAFSLSLGLVRAEQVDVDTFMKLLRKSALYAPTFDKKLAKMLAADYQNPNFPLKHLIKDVRLFQSAAKTHGLDEGVGGALLGILERAAEMGYAEQDYSSLYESVSRS